jgi:hypothetical protein
MIGSPGQVSSRRRVTFAGSRRPAARTQSGESRSTASGRSAPPCLRRSMIASGIRPRISRFSKYFRVIPLSLSEGLTVARKSIRSGSRYGARTSSDAAILARSTFTRMSS